MKGFCACSFIYFVIICIAIVCCKTTEENPCGDRVPCDNSQCINKEAWCNGLNDCYDGSDESYCKEKSFWQRYSSVNNCTGKHFVCSNGPCVPRATVCDEYNNCKDGSDEDDCKESSETASESSTSEEDDSFEETNSNNFDISVTEPTPSPQTSPYPRPTLDNHDLESNILKTGITDAPISNIHPTHLRTNPIISSDSWTTTSTTDYYQKHRNTTPGSYRSRQYPYPSNGHTTNRNDDRSGQQSSYPNGHTTNRNDDRSGQQSPYPNGHTTNRNYDRSRPQPHYQNGRTTNRTYVSEQQPNYPSGHTTNRNDDRSGQQSPYPNGHTTNRNYDRSRPQPHYQNGHTRNRTYMSEQQPNYPNGHTTNRNYDRSRPQSHYQNGHTTNRTYVSEQQPNYPSGQYGNRQVTQTDSKTPQYGRGFTITPNVPVQVSVSRYSTDSPPTYVTTPNTMLQYPTTTSVEPTYNPSVSQQAENDRFRNTRNSRQREGHRSDLVYAVRPHNSPPVHTDLRPPHDPRNPTTRSNPEAILPKFHFSKNYTQQLSYRYGDNVQRAEDWILGNMTETHDWGEDTPRALIALSLINNAFPYSDTEKDFMGKSLTTHIGMKLLKILRDLRRNGNIPSDSPSVSNSRLSLYIDALLATCQDPTQFLGNDLTAILHDRKVRSLRKRPPVVNPVLYLTLCLTNTVIEENELQYLEQLINHGQQDARSKDMQILATTALACFQRQEQFRNYRDKVQHAFDKLLQSRLHDGSFGGIYTTALALQALMSVETLTSWNPQITLDYIARHQLADGSFGDMLATYYALPALSGRSLLHLRNTECEKPPPIPVVIEKISEVDEILNRPGPRRNVHYTVKVGYPEIHSKSITLLLSEDTNFLETMKVAQRYYAEFKFLYDNHYQNIDVHTIAGLPNDPERDIRWHLYQFDRQQNGEQFLKENEYTQNIRDLFPREDKVYVFWYLRSA